MDQDKAIETIKEACVAIAQKMMTIHPAITAIQDDETKTKLYETMYALTANVETVKKLVIRLRKPDDSTLL